MGFWGFGAQLRILTIPLAPEDGVLTRVQAVLGAARMQLQHLKYYYPWHH